jgi:hypothetical protein
MAKFEAHITCDKEHAKQVEDIAQRTGWFFSMLSLAVRYWAKELTVT